MHICVKKDTEALKYFVDNFQMLDLKCREHDWLIVYLFIYDRCPGLREKTFS